MPSPSKTSSCVLVIFFLYYLSVMHACISSTVRVIDAAELQAGFTHDGHHQQGSGLIPVGFGSTDVSEGNKEEHARTKSGRQVVVGASSHVSFIKAAGTEASGRPREARVGLRENKDMDHQDIIEMDYHPPHRNSPIHNK